jgi:hypothetical protein
MPRTPFSDAADDVERRVHRDLDFLKDFRSASREEEGGWNTLVTLVARNAAAAVHIGRLRLAESSHAAAWPEARKYKDMWKVAGSKKESSDAKTGQKQVGRGRDDQYIRLPPVGHEM